MTLHVMTIIIVINTGDIIFNDITYIILLILLINYFSYNSK